MKTIRNHTLVWTLALVLMIASSVSSAARQKKTQPPASTAHTSADMPVAPPPEAFEESHSSVSLEIFYIPQEDLAKAPGYSSEGVFLPLSQVVELARGADATSTSSAGRGGHLACTGLELKGQTADPIRITGSLSYACDSDGWTAVPVNCGCMPWTSQKAAKGTQAFLARVNRKTVLFAKGHGTGTLGLEATVPVAFTGAEGRAVLGRFYAPCRLDLETGDSVTVADASCPTASVQAEKRPGVPLLVQLWPANGKHCELRLRRSSPLQGQTPVRASQDRTVRAEGLAFTITDRLELTSEFAPGTSFTIQGPPDAQIVSATSPQQALVEISGRNVTVRPLEKLDRIVLDTQLTQSAETSTVLVTNWRMPATVHGSWLHLPYEGESAVVLAKVPAAFTSSGSKRAERLYYCWTGLPDLNLARTAVLAAAPPQVKANLRLAPHEAYVTYAVRPGTNSPAELPFRVPAGWTLTDVSAQRGSEKAGYSLIQQDHGWWRIGWSAATPAEEIRLDLHKAGVWGEPGTTTPVSIPILYLPPPRPAAFSMAVNWIDSLDVRISGLTELSVDSGQEPGQEPQLNAPPASPSQGAAPQQQIAQTAAVPGMAPQAAAKLSLTAAGPSPGGTLVIMGREPDVKSTVVTVLSVGEDRTTVHALISYDVRFAPASTFRFVLPKGTGSQVRINEENLRENFMRSTPEGDEWTVVTQNGIIGPFAVSLEWPIKADVTTGAVDAPEIRVTGVSSQRGYVVLEGSEVLRLQYETSRNLSEADAGELPPLPWTRENRVLAVYRYVEPPYLLSVKSEKFQPEKRLQGLIREATLTSTFSADGDRLTRADYTLMSSGDRQFLEVELPPGASVWSVLVNGEGVKPGRQAQVGRAKTRVLVPLPKEKSADIVVSLLYFERAASMADNRRLNVFGPEIPVSVPVNKTVWTVNLPSSFEYLSYGGTLKNATAVREPVVSFLRSAYYPEKLVFTDTSVRFIFVVTLVIVIIVLAVTMSRNRNTSPPEDGSPGSESSAPPPFPPPPKEPRTGFRLIELLIVIVIVMILSAISVPNFLEAQTRSKVSRVKADQRSIATGIEAYFVDNNSYPVDLNMVANGPVKYITSVFPDVFADNKGETFHYVTGEAAYDKAVKAGLMPPGNRTPSYWMLYSNGPDAKDDGGEVQYDPTNGTVSPGDVIRVSYGSSGTVSSTFSSVAGGEVQSAAAMGYDPTNGTVSTGDVYRVPQGGRPGAAGRDLRPAEERARAAIAPRADMPQKASATPAPATPAGMAFDEIQETERSGRRELADEKKKEYTDRSTAAGLPAAQPATPSQPTVIVGDAAESNAPARVGAATARGGQAAIEKPMMNSISGKPPSTSENKADVSARQQVQALATARQAGFLSLGIDLPETGLQRRFEGLGGKAQIEIRCISSDDYLRLCFVIWMSCFLVLATCWLVSTRTYRIAFILGLAVSLIPPLLLEASWAGLFNAAFQGVLISLVMPLAGHFLRRQKIAAATSPAATLLIVCCLLGSGVRAERPAGSSVRVLVPYDTAASVRGSSDSAGFVTRDEFARLWKSAHPDEGTTASKAAPFLAQLDLEGALSPSVSAMDGTFTLTAVNPADVPSSVPVELEGFSLSRVQSSSADASLSTLGDSLVVQLPANWAGEFTGRFQLACKTQGATGEVEFGLPEAAAGQWRFSLPYADLTTSGTSGSMPASEELTSGTAVSGVLHPGRNGFTWSSHGRSGTGSATAAAAGFRTRVAVQTTVASLESADWNAELQLDAEPGKLLPKTVQLDLPPDISVRAVQGEQLKLSHISGSRLTLELMRAVSTRVRLEGLLRTGAKDARDSNRTVHIGPVRNHGAERTDSTARFEIAESLELVSVTPLGLQRVSASAARSGFAAQMYEASDRTWSVDIQLHLKRSTLLAHVAEVLAPADGFLHYAGSLKLEHRGATVRDLSFIVPDRMRVLSLEGEKVENWVQHGTSVLVHLGSAMTGPMGLTIKARSDLPSTATKLSVIPIRIEGASESRRSAAVLFSRDYGLEEISLAGATPQPPTSQEEALATILSPKWQQEGEILRSYSLTSAKEMSFGFTLLQTKYTQNVFNRVSLSDGVENLTAVVRSEPRAGRIREVEVLLALPWADDNAAARLQVHGSVRSVHTEKVNPKLLRATAELQAPSASAVDLKFELDLPADTATSAPLGLALVRPSQSTLSRTWLLVHRDLEGDVAFDEAGTKARTDPAQVAWPQTLEGPLPSDLALELKDAAAAPAVVITRHKLEEALRAVVTTMRQRVLLSEDGKLRCELEIVVQNQSEQFLRIALPYPKNRVEIYDVQVASRPAKATFQKEKDRHVLLVPLIRTGLLEPELTVRVAYAVDGEPAMGSSGNMEQKIPDILGGIPVARSSLVLMLPSEYKYSGFKGTLNQVEQMDLEVDEAVRQSKQVEKLSETALYAKGNVKKAALSKLAQLKSKVAEGIESAKSQANASKRLLDRSSADKDQQARQIVLNNERYENLKIAEQTQKNIIQNYDVLSNQIKVEQQQQAQTESQNAWAGQVQNAPVAQNAAQAQTPAPVPSATPSAQVSQQVQFPRTGDVYVFRQLQGTGKIGFHYRSKEQDSRAYDLLFAAGILVGAALLMRSGRVLFKTRRRVAAVLFCMGVIACLAKVAMDIAVPVAGIGLILFLSAMKRGETKAPEA